MHFCRFSRDCLLLIQYTNWFYIRACIVDYLINFRIATNAILILPIGIFFCLVLRYFYYLINKRNIQTLGREAKAEFGNEVTLEETELGLASKIMNIWQQKCYKRLEEKPISWMSIVVIHAYG